MTHGIDQARAASTVERLSNDATLMVQQVSNLLNAVSLTRAMQEGYRMACRDHGIDIPEMIDPAEAFGMAVRT